MIGKKATIDGTIIIGRNEDAKAAWPKRVEIHPRDSMERLFSSKETKLTLQLPAHSAQYMATPEWTDKDGLFEEDGINEYDVAMSATESAYTNELVLGYDPLVENGLNEEAMITVVLPYVKTAREGVARLGQLIAEHGTGETNGVTTGLPNGSPMTPMRWSATNWQFKKLTLTTRITLCSTPEFRRLCPNTT